MAKNKYTDLICILIVVFMLAVTMAFMSNGFFGVVSSLEITDTENPLIDSDITWASSDIVYISLEDGKSKFSNSNYGYVSGDNIVIQAAGVYVISGSLSDGSILVEAPDDASVQLVLNNVSITSSDTAPIYFEGVTYAAVTLADKTENSLTVTGDTLSTTATEQKITGALHSKCDLVLNGTGSLTVTTAYQNGIVSKGNLILKNGTYTVDATKNGIVGYDSLTAYDGTYTVTAGNDGMKSNNSSEEDKGYVNIYNGTYTIVAAHDGIQAETTLNIEDGDFDITTGSGSDTLSSTGESMGGGGMGGGGDMQRPSDTTDGTTTSESGTDTTTEGSTDTSQERPQMPSGSTTESDTTDSTSNSSSNSGEMPQAPSDGTTESGEMPTMPSGEPSEMGEMPEDMGTMGAPGETTETDTTESTDTTDSSESETSDSYKGIKSAGSLVINGGNFTLDTEDDSIHSDSTITITDGTFQISAGAGQVLADAVHSDDLLTITGGNITVDSCYEGLEGYSILIVDGNIDISASDDAMNASGSGSESSMMMPGMETSSTEESAYIQIDGGTIYVYSVQNADGIDANGDFIMNGGSLYISGYDTDGNQPVDWDGTAIINGGTLIATGSSGMQESLSSESEQCSILYCFTDSFEAGTEITLSTTDGEVLLSYTPTNSGNCVILSSADLVQGETYVIKAGDQEEEIVLESVAYTNKTSSGGGMGGGMQGGRDMSQSAA